MYIYTLHISIYLSIYIYMNIYIYIIHMVFSTEGFLEVAIGSYRNLA